MTIIQSVDTDPCYGCESLSLTDSVLKSSDVDGRASCRPVKSYFFSMQQNHPIHSPLFIGIYNTIIMMTSHLKRFCICAEVLLTNERGDECNQCHEIASMACCLSFHKTMLSFTSVSYL